MPFRRIIKFFGVDVYPLMKRFLLALAVALLLTFVGLSSTHAQTPPSTSSPTDLSHLLIALRNQAAKLEFNSAMRVNFESFTSSRKLTPGTIRYPDYVMVHLLFEATRDAGFWNMRWNITDQPPNSDRVWRQWRSVNAPSFVAPTAIAECDELSALYAFLVERAGVRAVGLFWPYPNHTVAVWMPFGRLRLLLRGSLCNIHRRRPSRLLGTPCRTEHRSETWAIPSLCRATPSATSERLVELLGSSPIPRSFVASCVSFQLRLLPSTGVTRLHRYNEPLRHPKTARPVSRELPVDPRCDHRWDFPCCGWSPLPACRRQYPDRFDGTCSLVPFHQLRPSLDLRRVGSCISGFEACSAFTHVTACTLAKSP
jgi:hypothetical protein